MRASNLEVKNNENDEKNKIAAIRLKNFEII